MVAYDATATDAPSANARQLRYTRTPVATETDDRPKVVDIR